MWSESVACELRFVVAAVVAGIWNGDAGCLSIWTLSMQWYQWVVVLVPV